MVCSLDGFIAKKDNSVEWLHSTDHFEQGKTLTEEAINNFLKRIDCYVIGARTYEQALLLGWPYGNVPVVVLTHNELKAKRDNVRTYAGDLDTLLSTQLKPQFNNIWVAGGADVTKQFIRQDLADEIIVSIMPIILGDGLLFFDFVGKEQRLRLTDVTAYKDGMVEMSYEILK